MKIGLIGYGSMGKAVESIARVRGHTVQIEGFEGADVAVDFSAADSVFDTIRRCGAAGIPLVEGTTGWYARVDEARSLVDSSGMGFLYSPNFSIGVYMYLRIVAEAARLVDKAEEYDVWATEIHHAAKSDSPSGTAKALERILLERIERKKTVVEEKLDRKREDSEIHFSSVRGGLVNFGHTIGFDSAADRILITHEARNRDGYALGAVRAAEWLFGKRGFFTMDDFARDAFSN